MQPSTMIASQPPGPKGARFGSCTEGSLMILGLIADRFEFPTKRSNHSSPFPAAAMICHNGAKAGMFASGWAPREPGQL